MRVYIKTREGVLPPYTLTLTLANGYQALAFLEVMPKDDLRRPWGHKVKVKATESVFWYKTLLYSVLEVDCERQDINLTVEKMAGSDRNEVKIVLESFSCIGGHELYHCFQEHNNTLVRSIMQLQSPEKMVLSKGNQQEICSLETRLTTALDEIVRLLYCYVMPDVPVLCQQIDVLMLVIKGQERHIKVVEHQIENHIKEFNSLQTDLQRQREAIIHDFHRNPWFKYPLKFLELLRKHLDLDYDKVCRKLMLLNYERTHMEHTLHNKPCQILSSAEVKAKRGPGDRTISCVANDLANWKHMASPKDGDVTIDDYIEEGELCDTQLSLAFEALDLTPEMVRISQWYVNNCKQVDCECQILYKDLKQKGKQIRQAVCDSVVFVLAREKIDNCLIKISKDKKSKKRTKKQTKRETDAPFSTCQADLNYQATNSRACRLEETMFNLFIQRSIIEAIIYDMRFHLNVLKQEGYCVHGVDDIMTHCLHTPHFEGDGQGQMWFTVNEKVQEIVVTNTDLYREMKACTEFLDTQKDIIGQLNGHAMKSTGTLTDKFKPPTKTYSFTLQREQLKAKTLPVERDKEPTEMSYNNLERTVFYTPTSRHSTSKSRDAKSTLTRSIAKALDSNVNLYTETGTLSNTWYTTIRRQSRDSISNQSNQSSLFSLSLNDDCVLVGKTSEPYAGITRAKILTKLKEHFESTVSILQASLCDSVVPTERVLLAYERIFIPRVIVQITNIYETILADVINDLTVGLPELTHTDIGPFSGLIHKLFNQESKKTKIPTPAVQGCLVRTGQRRTKSFHNRNAVVLGEDEPERKVFPETKHTVRQLSDPGATPGTTSEEDIFEKDHDTSGCATVVGQRGSCLHRMLIPAISETSTESDESSEGQETMTSSSGDENDAFTSSRKTPEVLPADHNGKCIATAKRTNVFRKKNTVRIKQNGFVLILPDNDVDERSESKPCQEKALTMDKSNPDILIETTKKIGKMPDQSELTGQGTQHNTAGKTYSLKGSDTLPKKARLSAEQLLHFSSFFREIEYAITAQTLSAKVKHLTASLRNLHTTIQTLCKQAGFSQQCIGSDEQINLLLLLFWSCDVTMVLPLFVVTEILSDFQEFLIDSKGMHACSLITYAIALNHLADICKRKSEHEFTA